MYAVSLDMETQRPKGNHTIPVPRWWMAAVAAVRATIGSDTQIIADLKRETGMIAARGADPSAAN